jgi:GTP:adenosylcobinamide-phosphate guanylyltransferase
MTNAHEAGWTAIILAGQRPGVDRLAHHFGTDLKALVEIGDEPMITHVVRTLHQVAEIGTILVLAQDPTRLEAAVAAGGGAHFSASASGISASIKAVAGSAAAPWPVLVTTADHPLLTPSMIREFLAASGAPDLSVAMVEKAAMLAQFPDAKRTWLKFSDGHWSGANLFAMTSGKVGAALDLWAAAEQDRKQVWKLFRHFGLWLAFRAITRTIGLSDALEKAGQRLGLAVKLVPMGDPVAAIDVDKPEDHVLASAILEARGATQNASAILEARGATQNASAILAARRL